MEDEIPEHSTNFCWVCFAGKMPASNILYNILWVQGFTTKPGVLVEMEGIIFPFG
jgi:hypothetical protein